MTTYNSESSDVHHHSVDTSPDSTVDLRWKVLYIVGAIAAVIAGVLFSIEIIGVIATGPPPTTVIGWFTLLQHDRLRGFFDLFFLDMVATALFVPMFLALYVALRRVSPVFVTLATILGLVGIAFYFASNSAFSMLSLSSQYWTATTDAQRSAILAQGQAALTGLPVTEGMGIYIAFMLNAIAGMIISIVMLRSKSFNKVTASVGILGNVFELGPPPGVLVLPGSLAFISIAIVAIGGIFLVIWYFLIAWQLFKLARGISKEEAKLPAVS